MTRAEIRKQLLSAPEKRRNLVSSYPFRHPLSDGSMAQLYSLVELQDARVVAVGMSRRVFSGFKASNDSWLKDCRVRDLALNELGIEIQLWGADVFVFSPKEFGSDATVVFANELGGVWQTTLVGLPEKCSRCGGSGNIGMMSSVRCPEC